MVTYVKRQQPLELKDDLAEKLNQVAKKNHVSPSDLIDKWLEASTQPTLLTDIIKGLPEITSFKGDPVEIQRKMRNEWD